MPIITDATPASLGHVAKVPIRKLRDADESLSELSDDWDEYRSEAATTYEPRTDPGAGVVEYVARISQPPPVEDLERRLRSVVSDARSALDNLVYSLGVKHNVSEQALKKNAFPIVDSKWGEARRMLKELPEDVVERIHDVQPLAERRDDRFPPHPLILLRDLSNHDKHRASISLGLGPMAARSGINLLTQVRIEVPVEDAPYLERYLDPDSTIDLDLNHVVDGAVVARFRTPEGVTVRRAEVGPLDLPLSLTASLHDGQRTQAIIPSLRDALRLARQVVRYVTGVIDHVPTPFNQNALAAPTDDSDIDGRPQ